MSSLPHVTVLMGTRNGATHLRQQLASIAAQDHPHWSLWISDDGSTDATWSTIRTFAQDQPNPVVLLKGPNRGAAINYLTLLCHPDLPRGPVAFADQDDLWLPTHLTRGLTALSDPAPAPGRAYVPNRLVMRDGAAPQPMPWRVNRPPEFRNALVECLMAGSGLMLDDTATSLARSIGPVDVPFWDWWLYLLLTGTGGQLLHDGYPGVIYRAHTENQLGPRHGIGAGMWRLRKLMDGTYRKWVEANLVALEPHIARLDAASQASLRSALALAPAARLRRLSAYRQWPRDRLALWLVA